MEQTTKELLSATIKEVMNMSGVKQETLSQKVNIDPKHFSRIEVDRGFPPLDTLDNLENALKVDLYVFFKFEHLGKNTRELKKIYQSTFARDVPTLHFKNVFSNHKTQTCKCRDSSNVIEIKGRFTL